MPVGCSSDMRPGFISHHLKDTILKYIDEEPCLHNNSQPLEYSGISLYRILGSKIMFVSR